MTGQISGMRPSVPVGPNGESYEHLQALRGPEPKAPRKWQTDLRDFLNKQGRKYLGPHGDSLFGAASLALQFTDAADLADAVEYGGKMGGAVQKGDWWGAAGAAPWMLMASGAAMMPGVSMGPADEAAQGVQKGIRAYHGSPHDFDRFDMSKIGTGEGAQAYGHGLYFAENEGIARSYRDTLSSHKFDYGNVQPDEEAVRNFSDRLADVERRKQSLVDDEGFISLNRSSDDLDALSAEEAKIRNMMVMDTINRNPHLQYGRMYEVEINADPDAFLDWDKPLSEQPEGVRKALQPRIDRLRQAGAGIGDDPDGSMLWRVAHPQPGVDELTFSPALPVQATNRLREAGIPGIKYLDAGSRGAGDGTRNYVVFDDKLISIVRKYGIAGASAMLGYNILDGMSEAQAAELKRIEPGPISGLQKGGGGW